MSSRNTNGSARGSWELKAPADTMLGLGGEIMRCYLLTFTLIAGLGPAFALDDVIARKIETDVAKGADVAAAAAADAMGVAKAAAVAAAAPDATDVAKAASVTAAAKAVA